MADTKLSNILGGGRRVQLYINHSLGNGDTFSKSVFLPFKPRQCIVRQAIYHSDPAQPGSVFLLRGISLDNTVLAIFPANNVPVEPGVVVDLTDKHLSATLQFQLQELNEKNNGERGGDPCFAWSPVYRSSIYKLPAVPFNCLQKLYPFNCF